MFNKSKWGMVGLAVILLISLSVVPASAQKKVIFWTHMQEALEDYERMVDIFSEKHPEIKVEIMPVQMELMKSKLVPAFLTGTNPDVLETATVTIAEFEAARHGWLDFWKPLAEDPEFKKVVDKLDKVFMYTPEGKLYGLPTQSVRQAMFIRKSWLERVGASIPQDWDELAKLAQLFTFQDPDGNGKDDTYGYGFFALKLGPPYAEFTYLGWAAAAGIKDPVVEDDGKGGRPSFNTERGIQTARFMQELAHKYKVMPLGNENWDYKDYYGAVQGSIVGMGRCAPWNPKSWDEPLKEDYIVTIRPPMHKGDTVYLVGSRHALAVAANSSQLEAALEWTKFRLDDEAQEIWLKSQNMASSIALDYASLVPNPRERKFWEFMKEYAPVYESTLPNAGTIHRVFAKYIHELMADPEVDPAELFARAEKECLEAIKE